MASYVDLNQFRSNSDLLGRVTIACLVAAEGIRAEDPSVPNHANRVIWARQAFLHPDEIARAMLGALLAVNSGLTVTQIQGVTDVQIQTGVNNAVNLFAG